MKTVTTYAQAYPFTGMPTEVDKYQVVGSKSHLTSKTTTEYCAFSSIAQTICGSPLPGPMPANNVVFAFPSIVRDIAYLHPEIDDLTHSTRLTRVSSSIRSVTPQIPQRA